MQIPFDVDEVCTDTDLATETMGRNALMALLPDEEEWLEGDCKSARLVRKRKLVEVLHSLGKRVPPIQPADLLRPEELKLAVVYGTLETLHLGAIEHAESPHIQKAKHYRAAYIAERDSLQPTIRAGATTSSIVVRLSRG